MIRAYDDNGNVVDLVKWEKQVRADGAREFAKWAENKGYFDDYYAPFLSDMLAEWQKGAEE